VPSNTVENKTT